MKNKIKKCRKKVNKLKENNFRKIIVSIKLKPQQ